MKTCKKWKEALENPELVEKLTLDVSQLPRVNYPNQKPMPPEIGKFKNLRHLEIKPRNLIGLCAEFSELKKLQSLEIANSEFRLEFRTELSNLPVLQSIEFYNIGLRDFVPLPKSLESLSLEANDELDVQAWCEGLSQLPQLHSLTLGDACPNKIPDALSKISSLKKLIAYSNDYKEIPPVIFEITLLEELNLNNNQIESISPAISKLQNLKVLSLGANSLTTLPIELFQLKKLEFLSIRNNLIHEIPEWIGQFTSLRELDLGSMPLNDLPPSVTNLDLKKLWIDAPMHVLEELKKRMPQCKIINHNKQDDQKEVDGWLKFYGIKS